MGGSEQQQAGQVPWDLEEARFAAAWTRCEEWLERQHPQGFVREAVAVRRLALGGERGVFASAPIAKGALLSATPLSAILCPACLRLQTRPHLTPSSSPHQAQSLDSRYAALVELLDKTSGSIMAFALLVLFELTQDPTHSPWTPYLELMPAQVDTLEWWEDRELRELDGDEGVGVGACWSVGSTAAIRARSAAAATFANSIRPMLRSHPAVFTQDVTEEQWRRALTIMTTRSFYIAELGSYALVPWADMYNHSHTITKDMKIYSKERQALEVYANKAYAANEQVFVTYGERLSNVQLLLNFGFVLPDNFTVLPLARLPPLTAKSLASDDKTTRSAPLGLPSLRELAASSAEFFLEFGERGTPKASDSLRALYRYLSATPKHSWSITLPTTSEVHFIEELVRMLLATRLRDAHHDTDAREAASYRKSMLIVLRRWEAVFLQRYQAALLSSAPTLQSSDGAS